MFINAGAAIQVLSVSLNIAAIHNRLQLDFGVPSTMTFTANGGGGFLILGGIVGASLWLWMALKNHSGRR